MVEQYKPVILYNVDQFGVSDVSTCLDSRLSIWGQTTGKLMPFSVHSIRRHMMSVGSITGDVSWLR